MMILRTTGEVNQFRLYCALHGHLYDPARRYEHSTGPYGFCLRCRGWTNGNRPSITARGL